MENNLMKNNKTMIISNSNKTYKEKSKEESINFDISNKEEIDKIVFNTNVSSNNSKTLTKKLKF